MMRRKGKIPWRGIAGAGTTLSTVERSCSNVKKPEVDLPCESASAHTSIRTIATLLAMAATISGLAS